MSKPKLKSRATSEAPAPKSGRGGGKLVESAQHIWLAGLGAFAKAQEEGTRMFEALVREGSALEQKTRKFTAGKSDEARSAVEAAVGQVRERSQETWDKLEKVFETRVSRALSRLGVPGSGEIKALTARVEELAREVHALNGGSTRKAAAKPATAKAAAARSVSRVKDELADVARELETAQLSKATVTPAKKPVLKKAARKPAAKAAKKA
ncbi:phasin family protein [Dokdonella sp. MW10]|uniref:phasin family protein n=1 Tax=Dokdonella sp. MW10 TaxID=2992926 RepID=UPI003F80C7E2